MKTLKQIKKEIVDYCVANNITDLNREKAYRILPTALFQSWNKYMLDGMSFINFDIIYALRTK